ncbi:ParB N-terminal domain-containing protein [Pseudomonas alliivorans]|nr:ParB N-terminal domain-containing protein [Pseudomonas alliivorans]
MSAISKTVPYNTLRRSPRNVRRKGVNSAGYKKGIEQLAMNILSNGLLQNLVVNQVGDLFNVAAGGRRFDALAFLVEIGKISEEFEVRVIVINSDEVVSASLSENVHREAMHPADELDAFLEMTADGWSVDRIATSFGVTALTVERRLKLRSAAPELIELLRNDEITLDNLSGLCATDNHELQLTVWNRCKSYYRIDAATLRREVLNTEVGPDDYRVKFIGGVEVYEKAGGECRRDLFAQDGQGVTLMDVQLLKNLVANKLQEMSESFTTQGWKWVEVWSEFDWQQYGRLGAAPTTKIELSEEKLAVMKGLDEELQNLQKDVAEIVIGESDDVEENETLDKLHEREQELHDEIESIKESCFVYTDAVKSLAGVVISFSHGSLRIDEGMVKTEDRKALSASIGKDQEIRGGRESESAGRKADAISDALKQSLLAHKNLAAQFAVAANPNAAKVLLVCKFVTDNRGDHGAAPIDLCVTPGYGIRTSCKISDDSGESKEKEFAALGDKLIESLPTDLQKLWDKVSAMSDTQLDVLLAYAVAKSVSLSSSNQPLSNKLVDALGFDMADNFTTSVATYLGRVSKDLIVAALTEAGKIDSDEDRAALLSMKKGPLAKLAQERLEGTRWVPELIRSKPATKAKVKAAPKALKKSSEKA